MAKSRFEKLITGNRPVAPPEGDQHLALLRGQLTLVGFIVGISYIFIDRYNNTFGNEPFYAATIVSSAAGFYLNRIGKYRQSSIFFLSTINVIIFVFSATETFQSGVYIFFIVASLTAFVLFGQKDRKLSLIFPVLSVVLFIFSYWGPGQYLLPKRVFTQEYIQISFTTNFIIAEITSIAIVYFLMDANFTSEKQILSQNDQLAKANSELDRFVYSASHDLRAPLSSILGLVQVYQMSDNVVEKDHVVGLIKDRVNKLDNFIKEILDYSRNSRLQLKSEAIHGATLVQEVIEGLRYAPGFEKVRFDIHAANETIYTDAERLKVVLNNLIANSLKYRDPQKNQTIIKVDFKHGNTYWSATIEDNGLGIHADHHHKIFGMFYRAHETSEGSGLGLYIVKEVVERMGGFVHVESTPGAGSAFTVQFPKQVEG